MNKKIMMAIIISLIFSYGVFTKDYWQIIPLNIGYFMPDTIDYIRRKLSE